LRLCENLRIRHGQGAVALLARLRRRSSSTVVARPEPVFANWFRIVSVPDEITFFEFDGPIHEESRIRKLVAQPTFGYLRLIGGFLGPEEMQASVPSNVRVTHRCTVSTSAFLRGKVPELPGMTPRDGRDRLTSMLRQAWDIRARQLGLLAYQTAAKASAWYFPRGLVAENAVQFVGPEGSKKRKRLTGWSEKRKVFWHLALEAVPSLSDPFHFVLRPHVIFTEDGKTPLQSTARMHALRRGFCKSWWNDRWRDLIAAFATWFAAGKDEIVLQMSNTAVVRIDCRMMELISPVGLETSSATAVMKEIDLAESDWMDDPDLDESEITAHEQIFESIQGEDSASHDDR
jgi:hypothetical protein